MYSIEDLSKELNLDSVFIRKLKISLWNILKNEVKKGDKNKDLFTSNAFVIFERVAKYKADGYSIKEITKQIEKELKTDSKTEIKQEKTENNTDSILLKSFLELQSKYIKDQEEKNNRILELSEALTTLRSELKLLPEGKTPAEIKTDWEKTQTKKLEKERLINELYNVSFFSFWKKRNIYDKIKDLET